LRYTFHCASSAFSSPFRQRNSLSGHSKTSARGHAGSCKPDRVNLCCRYRAPELLQADKQAQLSYGKPLEVFSYSIILWQLWMLKVPYADFAYSIRGELRLKKHVVERKGRPVPTRPLNCPKWFCNLMQQCWDDAPGQRPTFQGIVVRARPCPQLALIKFCINGRLRCHAVRTSILIIRLHPVIKS
jgi:hypothetical protein